MSKRKLCFSTLCCPDWSIGEVIDRAATLGFGGVEFRGLGAALDITTTPAFTRDLPTTLSAIRSRGLAVASLDSSVRLFEPDEQRWRVALEEFTRYVDLANKSEAKLIRIFPGSVGQFDKASQRTIAGRRLKQLIKIAAGSGARPALETHDAHHSTAAACVELLADIPAADLAVIWDVRHSVRNGEEIATSISLLGDRLAHIHIKDSKIVDHAEIATLVGQGDLPIADAVRAAEEAGFTGWFSLEMERRWNPQAPPPEQSLPAFISWMKSV